MLSVNKVMNAPYRHQQNNSTTFGSKFVPNEALSDAFYAAGIKCLNYPSGEAEEGRTFAKIIETLLNDGKNDLIKVTTSPKGSTLTINGKRVSFYSQEAPVSNLADDERALKNILYYYLCRGNMKDVNALTQSEVDAIQPSIEAMHIVTRGKNHTSFILKKMDDIYKNINKTINNHALKNLEWLERRIFHKSRVSYMSKILF